MDSSFKHLHAPSEFYGKHMGTSSKYDASLTKIMVDAIPHFVCLFVCCCCFFLLVNGFNIFHPFGCKQTDFTAVMTTLMVGTTCGSGYAHLSRTPDIFTITVNTYHNGEGYTHLS